MGLAPDKMTCSVGGAGQGGQALRAWFGKPRRRHRVGFTRTQLLLCSRRRRRRSALHPGKSAAAGAASPLCIPQVGDRSLAQGCPIAGTGGGHCVPGSPGSLPRREARRARRSWSLRGVTDPPTRGLHDGARCATGGLVASRVPLGSLWLPGAVDGLWWPATTAP